MNLIVGQIDRKTLSKSYLLINTKYLFLYFILNFCVQKVSDAQNAVIDSLTKIAETTHGTRQADALNELSQHYAYTLAGKSAEYAQQAHNESVRLNYLKGQSYALRNLASAYGVKKNFSLSIELSTRSLQISEAIKDSVGIGNNYITLGLTYQNGDHWQAISYFEKALSIFEKLNIQERVGVCKINMGFSYYILGFMTTAKKLNLEALKILENANHLPAITSCYRVLGLVAKKRGNLPEAIDHFEKVLLISKQLGADAHKEALIETVLALADIYKSKGDFNSELLYIKNADHIAEHHAMLDEQCVAKQLLVEYYFDRKDFNNAKYYMQQLKDAKAQLAAKESEELKRFMDIEQTSLKTQQEKNQLEIAQEHQQKLIVLQKQWLIGIIVTLLVTTILLFYIFRSNQIRKKLNLQLINQHDEIEKKTIALEELNHTKNKFFSIVAHDIRSPLNSVLAFSELLNKHIDSFDKDEIKIHALKLREMVSNTLRMAENLITWARTQMHKNVYKPEFFSLTTIVYELCSLFKPLADQKEINVEVELSNEFSVFADKAQITFIVRNILNNSLKFTSRGGIIRISSGRINESKLFLRITDNGVGMDESTLQNLFKTGVLNLHRARKEKKEQAWV